VNVTCTGSEIPALNVWNHLVFAYDATNYFYYLNGVQIKTGSLNSTLASGITNFIVGRRWENAGSAMFEEDSAVRQRIVEYGKIFGEMHVIVFTLKSLELKAESLELSKNVWVYPTNSKNKFFYIFDAKKIGVNVAELLISQPDTGEQALEIVETLVRSNAIDVIVVDSVAALTPKAEIEGEMGESHMGLQARLMSQALRKLTGVIAKTGTVLIFINQIRMKIGVMFGNPETTPGGNALKFYASVRMEIRRNAQIKQGEKIIGNRVKVKVVKNKVAPPFRTAEFDIMYNEGISLAGDLLDLGVEVGSLEKRGNSYAFGEEKLGVGRENAKQYLREHAPTMEKLREATKEAAMGREGLLVIGGSSAEASEGGRTVGAGVVVKILE
jgi:protein RecA